MYDFTQLLGAARMPRFARRMPILPMTVPSQRPDPHGILPFRGAAPSLFRRGRVLRIVARACGFSVSTRVRHAFLQGTLPPLLLGALGELAVAMSG